MGILKAENEALRARVAELGAREVKAEAAAKTESVEGSQPRSPAEHHSGGVPPTSRRTKGKRNTGSDSNTGDGEDACRSSLGKAGMTAAEIARYSRHLLVPAVGVEGQR